MRQVKVQYRQTVYDICIQEYGSLEFLGKIIKDNNILAAKLPLEGDVLLVDTVGFGDDKVKNTFSGETLQNNFPFDNSELITLAREDILLENASITLETLYT